jgi:O-antigen biosynthesis protein
VERIKHPQKLSERFGEPDRCDVSFVVLFEGWVEDLERLHRSVTEHLGRWSWELIVVDNPVDDADSGRIAVLDGVTHIPLRDRVGWAAGRNLGLRLCRGRIAVVIDTCVELTGDVVGSLAEHLSDPAIGLVGRWGVVTGNGFDYEESDGPDVDGVEAYLIAARRAILPETGLFHPKFKWYRNADLDLSFQVRAAGYRTVVDPRLRVARHVHRQWTQTPANERDEASRKNFFRFRDRWGERTDLYVRLDT